MSSTKPAPGTVIVMATAALSWLGLYVHNVADLPGQNLLSAETAYPTAVLLLFISGWFTPVRRLAAWSLLGWGWLHLIGAAILSVLPLPWWPYHPNQTLHHHAFHAAYGALQIPLLVMTARQVRAVRPAFSTASRLGDLAAAGAPRVVASMSTMSAVSSAAPSRGSAPDVGVSALAAGRPSVRRRDVLTVLVWLIVVGAGGLCGALVFDRVSSATEPAPTSESQRARHQLEAATGERDSIIAIITGTPDDTTRDLAADLRRLPGVHRVRNSANGQVPAPDGGGTTLVIGLRAGLNDKQVNATVDAVRHEFDRLAPGRAVLGGYPVFDRDLGLRAKADLARAEAIALPIVLILLGLAVRSAVGTALGLALVMTTVTGGLAILLTMSTVTDLSSFAVNVVTMFGIGLAVDYGLLVITRFRRERAHATTIAQAVATAMATSGRTVALSGVTVAVALAGLLVFAEPVVRSMAYAGIGAVAVAVASALTLLPVLLRRFGHRIPPAPPTSATGGFGHLARAVQRRPLLVAAASLGLLTVLAVPLGSLTLQGVDTRSLPAGSPARRDAGQLQQRLPHLAGASITVLAATAPTDPRMVDYLSQLRGLNHVNTVMVRPDSTDQLTIIDIAVDGPAGSRDAIDIVDRIRADRPAFDIRVTGLTARFNDFISGLTRRAPYAALVIALATFIVLLLATGGLLVAAKAIATNLASLTASLGTLVWTFQQGHLAGPLQFTPTGGLSLVIIVLTAVFAFGLSTDYEVFLLSSVVAARNSGADTDTAVATGIQRTGRIITVAALLIVVVFAGFAAGDVLIIKQLGLGLAAAVLLDATLVRLVLIPALMTLLGRHNWTGPHWARRASHRFWRDDR
jgi:RND superfamily putative drug exporter